MNLFLISNLGQLYQAQALIRKQGLDNNVLGILYTNMNTTIYDYLVGNVDKNLFDEVESVLLPNFPNRYTRKKLTQMRNQYELLFDKYNFERVFICSFEGHYNFIKSIASERGTRIALFEEGTATYKWLINEETQELTLKGRLKRALIISKNDFKKAYNNSFVKVVIDKSLIIQTTKASFKLLKRITAAFITKKHRTSIQASLYPRKVREAFGKITEFDELYVAFPDKAKDIFKAEKYNELISDYELNEESKLLIEKSTALKSLTNDSIVFVNQKYKVPNDVHVNAILSFFADNYSEEKIFIKFHPRDPEVMKEAFARGIVRYNLNVEIIDLDIEVPFESILKVKKPKLVIGISSTSLIYTKKINPETQTISCANYYISYLIKKKVNMNVINLLNYHKKILQTLSDIEIK
ncbi:alpha-2,8-polysialyltransferase family protein [Sutcliffiella horikoshii]|uniref:alpha-2,8-polysialyltransferase family protein n=1 Tax=Sutcliffiella horikoshii TaxID=79883 RepID=UPI00384D01C5